MKIEKDYEDLLRLFNKHKVKYCIVGAFATAFYAIPRYSKDMDILLEHGLENGRRIVRALEEFGFKSMKVTAKDFAEEGRIVQLGYEPIRADLLTSIDGVTFKEAWEHKKKGSFGGIKVFFIGINELIKNKRAVMRKQDEADLEILRSAKHRRKQAAAP